MKNILLLFIFFIPNVIYGQFVYNNGKSTARVDTISGNSDSIYITNRKNGDTLHITSDKDVFNFKKPILVNGTVIGGGTWPSDSSNYASKYYVVKSIHDSLQNYTTTEVDPVWIADSSNYYKKTVIIDSLYKIRLSINTKENLLGTPSANRYVLQSNTSGVRAWRQEGYVRDSTTLYTSINAKADTSNVALLATTNTFTQAQTAPKWKLTSGTSSQFLKGDGSTDASSYITLGSLSSTATGLTYTNTTGVFSLTSGYSIPTTANQTNWTSAYTFTNGYATNYPDLTAIEALTGSKGTLTKTSTNTWALYGTFTDSIATTKLPRLSDFLVKSYTSQANKLLSVNAGETGVTVSSITTVNSVDTSEIYYHTKGISLLTAANTQLNVVGTYDYFVPYQIKIVITAYTAGSGSTNPVISIGNNASTYDNVLSGYTLTSPVLNKIYTIEPTASMLTSMTTSPLYLRVSTAANYTTLTVLVIINGVYENL